MSKDLNPTKALIFRIVHRENMSGILDAGCHCKSTNNVGSYTQIGNAELIEKRVARPVECAPGGTLSDYVPFYFTPYTPMLYNIKTGYNGVVKRPMEDILILVSSLHRLAELKVPFVFSDRHAYLRTAQFSNSLADLDRIIWTTLQNRDFRNDDIDKFEKYQAEALVYKHMPLDALLRRHLPKRRGKGSNSSRRGREGTEVENRRTATAVSLMITFTTGNLLESDAEALVNTVNTVGVMGKGVALMFKEAFPENFEAYERACALKEVRIGKMFVTEREKLFGPKWIINFPTKAHWRFPSKIEWIVEGLDDLKQVIAEKGIKSIALPPLGAGNGGLQWKEVRPEIERVLAELTDVRVIIYEPTEKYQNVAKRAGVKNLTPARALIAELVRRYSILGFDCTLLEVQKLAYFLERFAETLGLKNSMDFQFKANKYGPYSEKLKHLLNGLDGSYLHCDKRLADAAPFDQIRFEDSERDKVAAYLTTPEARPYRNALEKTSKLIDGFESPLGMELLATVDMILHREGVEPSVEAVKARLPNWPGGKTAGQRKVKLFEDRIIAIALEALCESDLSIARA